MYYINDITVGLSSTYMTTLGFQTDNEKHQDLVTW